MVMETFTTARKSERVRKPRTKEAFLAWEQPAGKYKYEWVDGELEKTDCMMKNTERGIVQRTQRAFHKTKAFNQGGELFAETHVPVSETCIRIPDLSFFNAEQIAASEQGALPVPAWAIELISPNESGFKIERKALEYQKAGVQVLWCYGKFILICAWCRCALRCAAPGFTGKKTNARPPRPCPT